MNVEDRKNNLMNNGECRPHQVRLPGFIAEASLRGRLGYYNPEMNKQSHSTDDHIIIPQQWDLTAVHGNCCGSTRRCGPTSSTVDAVDEACKRHDICLDREDASRGLPSEPPHTNFCECHQQFIRDLQTALQSSHTSLWAKTKAVGIIGAFSALPCYCKTQVCSTSIKWCTGLFGVRYPCGTQTSCSIRRVLRTPAICPS